MKKKEPKISVIMPVYNAEKTIERAILSIINQTYNNIELILINDGSIDGTESIIKKYMLCMDSVVNLFLEYKM